MLQFFKKSGQREKPRSSLDSRLNSEGSFKYLGNVSFEKPNALYSLEEEEEEEDDISGDHNNGEVTSIKSRLSKTLPEILSDKGALGYFYQFLESRGSVALIKFLLEVECLCESCGVQIFNNIKTDIDNKFYDIGDGDGDRDRDNKNKNNQSNKESDDNDNYRFNNVTSKKTREQEEEEEEEKEKETVYFKNEDKKKCVNNKNKDIEKSNCDDDFAPTKTSQMVNRAEESNIEFKNNKIKGDETAAAVTDAADAAKQDALRIYKRYIIKDSLGSARIPDNYLKDMESALLNQDVSPLLKCLHDVQQIVYKVLEEEHIDEFLRSDFHCKHQIDVLTSGNVQLADILHNETAFFHFIEFMEIERKRELLDFWMSAVNYKQNLLRMGESADPMEAQTDALILYDKYFSLQATMPLGFSDKIRFQVEQNICREDGEAPRPDCFDKPCKIVYRFLNKHYLAAFLSSQLYYKYLSELISTIQSSPCPALHPRLRRTGSDCSSEISTASISTQNTISLGNDDSCNKRQGNKLSSDESMSIDTRQLYDPDSLWRRQKYNLSVGYVNDMGRFVTEIDPDPHRKYESRLSRAMKRLVNMENDKAKEEMAWKIAEMIVREITSLTLGVSQSHISS